MCALYHVCGKPRRIRATLASGTGTNAVNGSNRGFSEGAGGGGVGAGRALLKEMHPTAAVCGKPRDVTYPVIGEVEGFDRFGGGVGR